MSGAGDSWQASGFFYRIDLPDGRQSDIFVTSAHVLHQASAFQITVRRRLGADPIREPVFEEVDVQLDRAVYIVHPTEDLIGVFMHPILKRIDARDGVWPLIFAFGDSHIPKLEEIDALEDVVMAGCPLGIFDEYNNFPIFRRGVTASHAAFNYKGKSQFLIDMACHEGSSGSPIFSWSVTSYNRKESRYDLHLQPNSKLLGILSSGLDQIDPNSGLPAQHGHLGVAVRSSELIYLKNMALTIIGPNS